MVVQSPKQTAKRHFERALRVLAGHDGHRGTLSPEVQHDAVRSLREGKQISPQLLIHVQKAWDFAKAPLG